MKIEVVNVVTTATIGESVSLEELADLPFITYNPSRYFCPYFKKESVRV